MFAKTELTNETKTDLDLASLSTLNKAETESGVFGEGVEHTYTNGIIIGGGLFPVAVSHLDSYSG